jgi:hypothetical protein
VEQAVVEAYRFVSRNPDVKPEEVALNRNAACCPLRACAHWRVNAMW